MLRTEHIIRQLTDRKAQLREAGVTEVGLFGSSLKNERHEGSDVDVLIDFAETEETYGNFLKACEILEAAFKGVRVDIVTKKGLSPFLRNAILSSVRYV
ncbi:MAG: nucleotidyltransferase domain-containing protein [Flavobacteriales bacterium]|nr:nucleotidyltransferase domain-containing protein [Flavobacteriales bacterium]